MPTPDNPSAFHVSTPTSTTGKLKYDRRRLYAVVQEMDVITLVAGQQNYGFAIVCASEALWSFFKSPSVSNLKVLIPGLIAAGVLAAVSGPMVTSGDASSVGTGLAVATAVSVAMGISYVLRLLARFSETPKEIAAVGLLFAFAGFFSFSQNLLVDGFVTLPTIELPSLPDFNLDELQAPSLPDVNTAPPQDPEVQSITEIIQDVQSIDGGGGMGDMAVAE